MGRMPNASKIFSRKQWQILGAVLIHSSQEIIGNYCLPNGKGQTLSTSKDVNILKPIRKCRGIRLLYGLQVQMRHSTRRRYVPQGPRLVMQPLSCASFLLGVAVLSATLEPFVAIAHRELLTATDSVRGPETRLEPTVDKTITDEGSRSNALTRGEMVLGDAAMEKTDDRSTASSAAKHSVGQCGHGGGKDLSMDCYFRSRKLHPGAYFDGHIPFTADYRRPRNHPPKNN
ncbi:unnamed protein product [Triticum turgidum subsp. durum]|uniref:Uncharacterized protein n=1 Tax=Triticum turgidum subsp. durum TaxID=4567 RepID=A0A9R0ZIG3_TRITD|nr:unnamed protein product [Triticum turgidum subsp. durum]